MNPEVVKLMKKWCTDKDMKKQLIPGKPNLANNSFYVYNCVICEYFKNVMKALEKTMSLS